VPSLAASLLAASLLQVPFGSSVEVRLQGRSSVPVAGAVVGDFLVAQGPRAAEDGSTRVTLRPLALGVLTVPFPAAQPSAVEVRPTLAPDAEPRPLLIPEPAPFPWIVAAAPPTAAALALFAVRLLRRRSHRDPVGEFERVLAPLAVPDRWAGADAADTLARGCRAFLQAVTDAPCAAMTTRELSRLLAARLEATLAKTFALAFLLADERRFAGSPTPAEEAVSLVRDLLAAAPQVVTPAAGGRR
jgi:hypothetical protein